MGAKFLKLVDKHFPLSEIFNRRKVKISYRTTANMKKLLSSHNQKILNINKNQENKKMCNCRTPPCPLQGKCQTDNLVYQATVKMDREKQTYIGLASTTFKLILANHKISFNKEEKRCTTTLRSHIWVIGTRTGKKLTKCHFFFKSEKLVRTDKSKN